MEQTEKSDTSPETELPSIAPAAGSKKRGRSIKKNTVLKTAEAIDNQWEEGNNQATQTEQEKGKEEIQDQIKEQDIPREPIPTDIIMFEKVNLQAKDIEISKAYPNDTGFDLQANIDSTVILGPGQRARIGTGIKLTIPDYIDAQIRPKSGLAFKKGLTVLNTPGTIDPGYSGELKVIIINFGNSEINIEPGMKIAQLTFNYKAPVILKEVKSLRIIESTEQQAPRGSKGFGSTDTNTTGK